MDNYHLVGDLFTEKDRPQAFELRLNDHLPDINPASFKITEVPSIDPHKYFITSGDALFKSQQLEKDLWILAGKLRSGGGKKTTKKYKQYTAAVWKCAGKCRAMSNKLRLAKGEFCFLETEWSSDGQLICIPKNPRARQ